MTTEKPLSILGSKLVDGVTKDYLSPHNDTTEVCDLCGAQADGRRLIKGKKVCVGHSCRQTLGDFSQGWDPSYEAEARARGFTPRYILETDSEEERLLLKTRREAEEAEVRRAKKPEWRGTPRPEETEGRRLSDIIRVFYD